MDKGKLNFVIDALMFLCLMAMAGLGFLMYYILPPGRQSLRGIRPQCGPHLAGLGPARLGGYPPLPGLYPAGAADRPPHSPLERDRGAVRPVAPRSQAAAFGWSWCF